MVTGRGRPRKEMYGELAEFNRNKAAGPHKREVGPSDYQARLLFLLLSSPQGYICLDLNVRGSRYKSLVPGTRTFPQ